jgi:hypothetical protein
MLLLAPIALAVAASGQPAFVFPAPATARVQQPVSRTGATIISPVSETARRDQVRALMQRRRCVAGIYGAHPGTPPSELSPIVKSTCGASPKWTAPPP